MMKTPTLFQGYDLIGDVHGCADALETLLSRLGYKAGDKGYTYQDPACPRQAIFLGDLIDRGNHIRRTLALVKAMCDNGSAQVIMGNHEFNALAYHTPVAYGFLRQRNARSEKQIKATLDEFAGHEQEWQMYLGWFQHLPFFLEFENFRVVHACWDQLLIEEYWRRYGTAALTDEVLCESEDNSSFAARFIERATRGISLRLPDGLLIRGRDGFHRHSFRVHFWGEQRQTYNDVVFQPDPLPQQLRQQALSAEEKARMLHYSADEKPLFIGHYWLRGQPQLVSRNIACLDYSAVNNGKLVAYRMEADARQLDAANFVFVDLENHE